MSDSPPGQPNGTIRFRLDSIERRLTQLEQAKIDVLADRAERLDRDLTKLASAMRDEIRELKDEMIDWRDEGRRESNAVRKSFYTFVFGMLVSVIGFALAFAYG